MVFGKVIDGMLTVRKIENVPTGPNNRPKLAVKIVGGCLSCYLVVQGRSFPNGRVRRDVNFFVGAKRLASNANV